MSTDNERYEKGVNAVESLIANATYEMFDKMDNTLRKIAKLPWYSRWKASTMAEQCLGIGRYSPTSIARRK